MSTDQQPERRLPPYVPYRTFVTFIDSMRAVVLPSHIDRDVMGSSMSNGTKAWLRASLRVTGLIDAEGVPQDRLRKLVPSEGEQRKALLRDLFNATYAPLFKGKVDLQTTTSSKLRAAFVELGAQQDTAEKCMAFLTALAKDAGLTLSPHLKRATPQRRSRPRVTRPPAPINGGGNPGGEQNRGDGGTPSDLTTMLLEKFPTFDPGWPDDVKSKWFDGFDRLMKATKG
jgi:hypothetical protein